MHRHNRSTPTLIAQCFVRIFFSPTLFSYCGTMPCFCICKTSEEMNAFGKNIILRNSGDRSHMTEFLYYHTITNLNLLLEVKQVRQYSVSFLYHSPCNP